MLRSCSLRSDTMRHDVLLLSVDNAVFEMHGREEFTARVVRAGSREHRHALRTKVLPRERCRAAIGSVGGKS
jgi:hypothetical protein